MREGYHIFTALVVEDKGYLRCAEELQAKVKIAEKDFDIVFLSGASFKDNGSADRNTYFGQQSAVLTKKQPPQKVPPKKVG